MTTLPNEVKGNIPSASRWNTILSKLQNPPGQADSNVNFIQVFAVKNYGASGNGTTDDSSFVTAAHSAAVAAGGGVVYFNAPGNYRIATNTTIGSAQVAVKFAPGATISVPTGVTVTIAGPLDTQNAQVFSLAGTGVVAFNGSWVEKVVPQWWGATGNGTTDDSTAIQYTINAAQSYAKKLFFPPGNYKVNSTLTATVAIAIEGSGYMVGQGSRIFAGAAITDILNWSVTAGTTGGTMENVLFDGAGVATNDVTITGISTTKISLIDVQTTGAAHVGLNVTSNHTIVCWHLISVGNGSGSASDCGLKVSGAVPPNVVQVFASNIEANNGSGVVLLSGDKTYFLGGVIEGNQFHGIWGNGTVAHATVQSVWFEGNAASLGPNLYDIFIGSTSCNGWIVRDSQMYTYPNQETFGIWNGGTNTVIDNIDGTAGIAVHWDSTAVGGSYSGSLGFLDPTSVIPVAIPNNLVDNSAFDVNLNGWKAEGTGTTIALSTAQSKFGGNVMLVTKVNSFGRSAFVLQGDYSTAAAFKAANVGRNISVGAWVYVPTANPDSQPAITFEIDGGNQVPLVNKFTKANAWQWVTATYSGIQSGGTTLGITFSPDYEANANTDIMYVSGVIVSLGAPSNVSSFVRRIGPIGPPPPTYPSRLTPSLWYDMETLTADGKMEDLSGKALDGTITGTSVTAGQYGGARSFATTDHIDFATVLVPGINFTMAGWAKWTTNPTPNYATIVRGAGNTWDLRVLNTGVVQPIFYQATGPDVASSVSTPIPYNDGNWHHFVGVLSNGTCLVYVDGTLAATAGSSITSVLQTAGSGTIGVDASGFSGSIDEVWVFPVALSAQQVLSLYQDTLVTKTPPVFVQRSKGVDNRSGVTSVDGSPITLYTSTAANQLYRASLHLNATAYTSGTATYTLAWTENSVSKTRAITAAAANTPAFDNFLIKPDNATAITAQLTGPFSATVTLATTVEQMG